jgi:hypothetical protein
VVRAVDVYIRSRNEIPKSNALPDGKGRAGGVRLEVRVEFVNGQIHVHSTHIIQVFYGFVVIFQ